MASFDPYMILILFLKFGKFETCDAYELYSYNISVYTLF